MSSLVYSNDRNGNQIFGDINVLIQEIRNGKRVRVLIEFDSVPGQEYITEVDNLWIKGNIVSAQSIAHISASFAGNVLKHHDDAYHWFIIVDTRGNIDMSRWNVGEHKDRGHKQDRINIKWFVF